MGQLSEFVGTDRAVIDPNGASLVGKSKWISSHSPEVECPWCGELNRDLWEFKEASSPHEMECQHCERPLSLTIESSVTYTLEKREA
jgi:hypothetical protein